MVSVLCMCASVLHAQNYNKCTYHYFSGSRKISTSECFDDAGRWGKAIAYDRNSKVIYEQELRRVAGHSYVVFKYYPDGAVQSAHWSSAPDGGIQWYKANIAFSPDGAVISETEDSYDRMVTMPAILKEMPEKQKKDTLRQQKQETAECAVIYSSEFWVKNFAPYPVVVTARRKSSVKETYILSLHEGETQKGGHMILAQYFDDPSKYYDFEVVPAQPGKKQRLIVLPSDERKPEQYNKETRRYFYEVRRVI